MEKKSGFKSKISNNMDKHAKICIIRNIKIIKLL